MKKLIAIAIVAVMALALCTTAFAASHAVTGVTAGEVLLEESFDGELDAEKFNVWTGSVIEDGKLHLGSGDWIATSPIAHTVQTFKDYIATFKMVGDKRDCYYGFGLRVDGGHQLMNGGRFGVPQAGETSVGIAIDIFGAGNSTLGDNIGITFCDGGANGEAPNFMVARPSGYDPGEEAEFKIIDTGDKITITADGKEIVTIELSDLTDGKYTNAAAYDASGNKIFEGAVSVFEEGALAFYQRNNHITIDDVKVCAIAAGQQQGGNEQQGGNPGTADAAVIAIAAVACIALAGVVVAKKVR
jgi:hypothetical protein